jgi:predicted PurR-regulated permease PerM
MRTEQTARRFFLFLLVVATLLLGAVVYPLASSLFAAVVLAGVLWPAQVKLAARLGNRRRLSAGLFVAAVVLLVVGPLVALSTVVVTEGRAGLRFVTQTVKSEGVHGLLAPLPEPVRNVVLRALEQLPTQPGDSLDERVQEQVSAQSGNAAAAVGTVVAATGSLMFQAVLTLIALFFLLASGDHLVVWLDQVSPLRSGQTHELLREFKKVSYAVIVSTVLTAGIQAAVALIGYLIARVPHPVFFSTATFIVAFIPAVGAASVCQAAALLLYLGGHPYAALFLSLWGLLAVGLVDNIVKPLLIRGEMNLPGAVVFFSLLGGLATFGAVGLVVGPLSVALFVTVLRMYQRDFITT